MLSVLPPGIESAKQLGENDARRWLSAWSSQRYRPFSTLVWWWSGLGSFRLSPPTASVAVVLPVRRIARPEYHSPRLSARSSTAERTQRTVRYFSPVMPSHLPPPIEARASDTSRAHSSWASPSLGRAWLQPADAGAMGKVNDGLDDSVRTVHPFGAPPRRRRAVSRRRSRAAWEALPTGSHVPVLPGHVERGVGNGQWPSGEGLRLSVRFAPTGMSVPHCVDACVSTGGSVIL